MNLVTPPLLNSRGNPIPLTVERAHERLAYDPETGVVTWRPQKLKFREGANQHVIAGTRTSCGYLSLILDRKSYLVHRVIWLLVHGRWPSEFLDHVNGDGTDNRLINLREATNRENQQNQRRPQGRSGLLGVSYNTRGSCWTAHIQVEKRPLTLGHFADKEMASAAYLRAKVRLHPFQSLVTPEQLMALPSVEEIEAARLKPQRRSKS